MGDRICIRLTDGDRTSPLFYGHWCGISALKDMSDALRDENNGMMNIMCNFIVRVMGGKVQPRSYYLYNYDESNATMADWDNWCWTFDMDRGLWTTTFPGLSDRSMTMGDVDDYVARNGDAT